MLGIIFGLTNDLNDEQQKLNEQKPKQVEILSAFYGYSNCLGLDSEAEIIANGCVYGYDESGKFSSNVPSRNQVRVLCGKMFVIRFQKYLIFTRTIGYLLTRPLRKKMRITAHSSLIRQKQEPFSYKMM